MPLKKLMRPLRFGSKKQRFGFQCGLGLCKMAALASDVMNSVWHAFNALDDQKTGQVPKSRLKVLTANLGTLLEYPNVEKGLQDHRSTSYLKFDDYMFYLRKELFTFSQCILDAPESRKYQQQIEEVCWLVCRKQYLTRELQILPDVCVYQLYRIFCLLGELIPCPQQIVQVVLPAEEVAYIAQAFVIALGREWDQADFEQIAAVIPAFKFSVFVALLESHYAQSVEITGLTEAVQELFDIFINDVIKMGYLYKKGQLFNGWKENWFVLQPNCLTYCNSRNQRDKRAEIPLNSKCIIENLPETNNNTRAHRFAVVCDDKSFELSAVDHKTKLQWILALQTAIEHAGLKESYQKRLAAKRKAEREAADQKRQEEERQRQFQKELLEKQQAELEAEKLARLAAEQQAKEQTALREAESQRLKEVEEGKKELERLLEEERQAKRDEEIVRNLQARVLREEWEKREELERLRDEQRHLLEEERCKREGLESQTHENARQLEDALAKLKELEAERIGIGKQLLEMKELLKAADKVRETLEGRLKEAQDKMIMAERAKEVLEAKLKVREKSLIPVPVKTNWNNKTSPTDYTKRKPNDNSSVYMKRGKNQLPSDGEDEVGQD